MKTTKILSIIVAGLITAGLVSIGAVYSYKKAHAQLEWAQLLLYENNPAAAKKIFAELETSSWVKKDARLGSVITAVLTGDTYTGIPLPEKEEIDIDDFHLPRLLRKQFVSSAFDRCMELAVIGRSYGVEAADIYYSAAMLERGETQKAFGYYMALSKELKNTVMGHRLNEAFELLQAGARQIIRDRWGKLVGIIDANREFKFYRPEYTELVQPVVIKELLNHSTKKGLRLSIDLELSRLALESLGENRGSIVLVKPGTGEVLAAVSDQITVKKTDEESSPAFEQLLEPASILKLVTVTAAFRNNIDPDIEIEGTNCRGAKRYNGKILYCPSGQGELHGLDHALAVSCNTAFADLGVKVGWEKMLEELRLFGFDSSMSNPFPLGKIIIDKGDDRSLADLSIGLENTSITPVHGALIASVFADDGAWVYPELLNGEDGFTGLSPGKIKRDKGIRRGLKIVDDNWLPSIRGAMAAVTGYGGTAAFITPEGFPVWMKTGTGGNHRDGYHINYIGFVPRNRGNIAFCVRVTDKRTSSRVRKAGFSVNRALLFRLKRLTGTR